MHTENTTVIVGPPGTGKTTDLLNIVEQLLMEGIKPWEIAFISFTKKATEEAKERAMLRFGFVEKELPHYRTIHSFAFRHIGVKRDQVFGWQHLRELGRMLGIDFKGRKQVDEDDVYGMAMADRMLFMEGFAKNTKQPLRKVWSDAMEDDIDWFELDRLDKTMQAFKHSRSLVDYNDMLIRFNSTDPRTLPKLKALIVDEAQDLSALQWDAVKLLSYNADRVYIAGDDDQAIFSWSGADVKQFMHLTGAVKTLPVSHRLPRSVHAFANALSHRISERRPKDWSSKAENGALNWFSNFEEIDMSKDTWLLLARNGYMLEKYEEWCLNQGLSFRSVNRDPLKSPSLAAIRVWENLRRGLDQSTDQVRDMLKFMDPANISTELRNNLRPLDGSVQQSIVSLAAMGLDGRDSSGTYPIWHVALSRIPAAEREFYIAARRRGEPLLKEPRIKISTIHAAKGGEADNVVLLTDISYRCFANMQDKMDDEIRVWYVGATRCKKSLNLVMPTTQLSFDL